MQLDDLYGLPLDRFVPERGALAKALRAEGRRDEAAAAAKLRKPSVPAWAVNQLVRSSGAEVDELFAAGDAVREAQSDVLRGRGDARALREAGAREREAVDALVDAARGLLSDASPATLDRVADTLHAAALDEESRAAVRGGRLERELRHAGLGLGEGAEVFAAEPKAPAPKKDTAAERKAAKERAAAEAAERRRARTAAAQAAKAEERAGHALRAAQERRDRAAQALADADAALEDAQAKARDAAAEHRRARAQLDGA
ncbi:MAG: hypothetical protein QOD69_22 [Solirubrobacteraceae bacterium]|nr:hypothetical protein [Solirubrobacteraceae bacterium]